MHVEAMHETNSYKRWSDHRLGKIDNITAVNYT